MRYKLLTSSGSFCIVPGCNTLFPYFTPALGELSPTEMEANSLCSLHRRNRSIRFCLFQKGSYNQDSLFVYDSPD